MTIGFYYARPDIASQKNEPRKSNVLEPLFKEYWHCWQKKGHHQGALLGGMGCWIISWSLLYWGENLKHLLQKLSDIGSGEKELRGSQQENNMHSLWTGAVLPEGIQILSRLNFDTPLLLFWCFFLALAGALHVVMRYYIQASSLVRCFGFQPPYATPE